MQEQSLPVLILAQSGRFLAQSASQAGYSVWVADCFGDQDTLAVADRWQQVPSFSKLTSALFSKMLTELTQGEPCILITGSGIELYYPLLENLPDNVQLVGNSVQTIKQIKTPALFFSLLEQLELPHPRTQFKRPQESNDYLVKSASGLGGNHIQYLEDATDVDNSYFQHLIAGNSGSALILANGIDAQIISINQQFLSPRKGTPFRLGSIETPWEIPKHHRHELEQAINKITVEVGLLGLNSIDFIISKNNELQLLEINPRPSASAELIESEPPLFQHHIDACSGDLPYISVKKSTIQSVLHYFYADHDYMIPLNISWPIECHDLPHAGTNIKKGQPICTIITKTNTVKSIKQNLIIQLESL